MVKLFPIDREGKPISLEGSKMPNNNFEIADCAGNSCYALAKPSRKNLFFSEANRMQCQRSFVSLAGNHSGPLSQFPLMRKNSVHSKFAKHRAPTAWPPRVHGSKLGRSERIEIDWVKCLDLKGVFSDLTQRFAGHSPIEFGGF